MEEPRGASAIDTIQRPTLPPLPPAIHAIRNPGVHGTVPPVVEAEVVEAVPIVHEDVEVFTPPVAPAVPEAAPVAVEVAEPVGEVVVEQTPVEAVDAEVVPIEAAPAEELDGDAVATDSQSVLAKLRENRTKKSGLDLDNKKLLIGLFAAFAVVFIIAGIRVTGVLTNTALVTSLDSGDCIEDFFTPNEGEFREIFLVGTTDCANPHAYEVYAVGTNIYTESSYPGVEAVFASAQAYCDQQYSSFVGGDFLSSPWNVWTFAPTEDRWNEGERKVQCIVGDFDQTNLTTGSLQGAGR